jgi:hypothetical protein
MEATQKPSGIAPASGLLKGLWLLDRERSDISCYARQLDLMRLTGVQKSTTVNLYRGIDVKVDDEGVFPSAAQYIDICHVLCFLTMLLRVVFNQEKVLLYILERFIMYYSVRPNCEGPLTCVMHIIKG